MATPEEVAKSVVMMCSDQFTFMTGSDVLVDGGEFLSVSNATGRDEGKREEMEADSIENWFGVGYKIF